jgi:phage protein D
MSTAPAPPPPTFLDQDLYVPYFKVNLVGQPLPSQVVHDIITVTYKDSIDAIDSFEITISNWDDGHATYKDVGSRQYKYSDQDLFDPGKKIELWMGYYGGNDGNLRKMLTGEITSNRPSFPNGSPTMVIGGLNLLHTLRREPVSTSYVQQTDSQIAATIAKRLGVEFNPDRAAGREEPFAYLIQDNQLDIVFLMDRARRIGYDLFVEEPTTDGQKPILHFQPSLNSKNPVYQLNYGTNLLEFQPNFTTAKQVGEVTVRGWDAVKKEKIEVTVTRKDLKIKTESSVEESFNQRKEVLATVPIRTKEEAKELALQTLTNIAKDMIKGTGSTIGLPDLRAGNWVNVGGVGQRFSKTYFVTASTHTIGDSGYITQFECRLEDQGGPNASGQN